jgi:hypothetical protein
VKGAARTGTQGGPGPATPDAAPGMERSPARAPRW